MRVYDCLVVGAGHAGIEAALAAARRGADTLLITISIENIAQMSCNPAIGGLAKSQLVFELDALGGEIGRAADRTAIQMRILNTKKGQAVQSRRIQCDKNLYRTVMRKTLYSEKNLTIKQGMVCSFEKNEREKIWRIRTDPEFEYYSKTLVLATGTFLEGVIHIGNFSLPAGRLGDPPSDELAVSMRKNGLRLIRLKTGTPPRIDKRTIDFSVLEKQDRVEGRGFSHDTPPIKSLADCYIVRTNERTEKIIKEKIKESALYSGRIEGRGPRYCPSIEDKIMKFEKSSHLLYLEPEGLDTVEMYLAGFSMSLPENVQVEVLRTLKGFENARIIRPAYAVEYSAIDPTTLDYTLESRQIEGLFLAGQINGTSGYEEAAAQGWLAGVNASLRAENRSLIKIDREQAYIGVLVSDLVTRGVKEPYRLFTSLAERRLELREDNADRRLTRLGYEVGLVSEKRLQEVQEKYRQVDEMIHRLESMEIQPDMSLKKNFDRLKINMPQGRRTLKQLLKIPGIDGQFISELVHDTGNREYEKFRKFEYWKEVEVAVKYQDYIEKERELAEKIAAEHGLLIPDDIDFDTVRTMRTEAREHMKKLRPATVGEAAMIQGVTPADIQCLVQYIKSRRRNS